MFDYIIIGAGPGGMDTAIEAYKQGKSVLLLEKDNVGGTCLNKGCIPTKALLASAKTALELSNVKSDGCFEMEGGLKIDLSAINERKNRIVTELRDGASFSLSKIEMIKGEAEIIDKESVRINGETYQARNIIIATGSEPARLNIPGADKALTSDDFLLSSEIWKDDFDSFVIIGGGVIGIEFATIIKALFPDKQLTVVEYCKEILPPFDKDIAKRLRMTLSKQGIKFITGAAVKEIKDNSVIFDKNGKEEEIPADRILMATGRKPHFPKGIENIGIEYDHKGIKVDEHFRTSVENIYAIGDVNGKCMLAHAASAQGRAVLGEKTDCNLIPSAVFSIPECAMAGLTEEECKTRGMEYTVKKAFFRANGKAVCMGETEGLIKIIVSSQTEEILGVHILGPHASDLIAEPTLAIASGLKTANIKSVVHAHPTLNEIIFTALNE